MGLLSSEGPFGSEKKIKLKIIIFSYLISHKKNKKEKKSKSLKIIHIFFFNLYIIKKNN